MLCYPCTESNQWRQELNYCFLDIWNRIPYTVNQKEAILLSKKTIKEKKDKKKKKDPNALKFRRVVSNNLFVLKIIHKVAPSYLPTYFLWSVGNAILDFLMSIWLLREIVNRYELGRPASEVIGMLLALIAAQLVWWLIIDTLPQIVYPRYRQKIVERIQTELFEKAAAVELECYENPVVVLFWF